MTARFALAIAILALAGCATVGVNGFVRLEVFGHERIAFSSDDALSQALTTELGSRGFGIVERARLDAVISEQALNQSGLLKDQQYLAAGKIANVRYIVSVSSVAAPDRPGAIRNATVRFLDAQTGDVVGSVSYDNPGSPIRGGMMHLRFEERDSLGDAARKIADYVMTLKPK